MGEADRLLRQTYQDWLPSVAAAAGTQRDEILASSMRPETDGKPCNRWWMRQTDC